MEHIVQFAVDVDDNRIRQIMEQSAARQVMDDIQEFSHGKSYYGNKLNDEPRNLEKIFYEEISKYVKEHADEIVPKVVEQVSKNMMRTNKMREAMQEVIR